MQIHPSDNVEVRDDGQKYALTFIKKGDNIIKYGFPIGHALCDIKVGEFVSPHNLKSNLSGIDNWEYNPYSEPHLQKNSATFKGYLRKNGDIGIRNEIWIIPTVGCINDVAKLIANKTGAKALTHPYGCSQLGGDLLTTQKFLCGLIKHPNAAAVLVLSLGCENNRIELMKEMLGEIDEERIRFLSLQDCEDEVAEAVAIIEALKEIISNDKRVDVPISKLRIGVKCGGSDGYSGITANRLVGMVSDKFFRYDATILMSEIPEVFGAEPILLSRSDSVETFNKCANMINSFRQYFLDHGESIGENPSPGNIAGGISSLEEKSLGCVQKAGTVTLRGALDFGEVPYGKSGLYMVNGPGNDQVACTALACSSAHIILFTTGRGTPYCSVIPTLKISTNNALFEKKPQWIDFNAGSILTGADKDKLTDELFNLCIETSEGRLTKGEEKGYYDIAIFKDGVTL
ncbi:MAG: altronate dehydratase family protein [Acutalibacteraceae bacterium]|nr:altronate dehydratase family protein [Acutalibacteraceae bacterium]